MADKVFDKDSDKGGPPNLQNVQTPAGGKMAHATAARIAAATHVLSTVNTYLRGLFGIWLLMPVVIFTPLFFCTSLQRQ